MADLLSSHVYSQRQHFHRHRLAPVNRSVTQTQSMESVSLHLGWMQAGLGQEGAAF